MVQPPTSQLSFCSFFKFVFNNTRTLSGRRFFPYRSRQVFLHQPRSRARHPALLFHRLQRDSPDPPPFIRAKDRWTGEPVGRSHRSGRQGCHDVSILHQNCSDNLRQSWRVTLPNESGRHVKLTFYIPCSNNFSVPNIVLSKIVIKCLVIFRDFKLKFKVSSFFNSRKAHLIN